MTDSAEAPARQAPNEVYGVFAGMIDQGAVARLANAAAVASSNSVTHIHLAFQTVGGNIADGVAIYNLLKAIPVPLTAYNIGSIASAGVIAYLGSPRRAASRHSTFMIHRTMSPALAATSERLNAMARSVVLDDNRVEAIFLEAELAISAEQKAVHAVADLWLSADEAKSANLITNIAEFAPPKGTQLFAI